jgi:cytochrome c-L
MTNAKKVFATVVVSAAIVGSAAAWAMEDFRHTITGEDLKVLENSPAEGRDTEAAKHFLETGLNLYTEVKACLPAGEEAYATACSGCHGHVAEGKVGPGLNDAYWTYPKNKSDKGLFETMYGGAQGMMGPHSDLTIDETLKLMAWIRHLYTGDIAEADWLTDEQKKSFKPYKLEEHASADGSAKPVAAGECKVPAAN